MTGHNGPPDGANILIVLAILLVPSIYVMVWTAVRPRRRADQLQKVIADLGVRFQAQPDQADVERLFEGVLFGHRRPHSFACMNWLQAQREEFTLSLIDRKDSETRATSLTTVLCIEPKATTWPCFVISPSNHIHYLPPRQRVAVNEPEAFNRFHCLTVDPGAGVNLRLGVDFLRSFAFRERLYAECLGDRLLVYNYGECVDADEVGQWLDFGVKLGRQLTSGLATL